MYSLAKPQPKSFNRKRRQGRSGNSGRGQPFLRASVVLTLNFFFFHANFSLAASEQQCGSDELIFQAVAVP